MYERNAIVLERYFNQLFGYNQKSNVRTNFKDYSELVNYLEQYKNVTEEEEKIIQEYDDIANKIREKQKMQENLYRKNTKLQEEINNIFQNLDESSNTIQRKIENVCANIQNVNEAIKENAEDFVNIVSEFSEKSNSRSTCGRTRRNIENDYNKKLNEMLDNYQAIDVNIVKIVKNFTEQDTEKIEKDLKERILKNGEKEKIPFNKEVITKSITLAVDIQKRETDILSNIYDKTNKLFTEIKNNSTKIDKHKKIIKDSKSKLEFIAAIKEYLVQFMDNERLTAVNGEEEHKKLMKEACKNLDEDLIQINNLFTLLLKEITKKVTKKSYTDLYNIDYLMDLEKKAEEFDSQIKQLNISVTIINPNHWRIDGMKKIYDVFYKCVTEYYNRDLSEYMPKEEEFEEDDDDQYEEEFEEEDLIEDETDDIEVKEINQKSKKDSTKSEIDKKIDMILGFDDEEDEEDWEEDEDDWEEDDLDEDDGDEDLEDEDNYEKYEEESEEDEEQEQNSELEDEDDNEYEFDGEEIKPVTKNKKTTKQDNWEDKFVNIEEKPKKKKSFFDKFKK